MFTLFKKKAHVTDLTHVIGAVTHTVEVEDFGVCSKITQLPGNRDVCIFHAAVVPLERRGQGLGTRAHGARLLRAKELNYKIALCTVVDSNVPEKKILVNHGWHLLWNFYSKRTHHLVGVWLKDLETQE